MPRPKTFLKESDILTAARLHYSENRNRTYIATMMGISIDRVSELLKAALDRGFVRIQLVETTENSLERGIQRNYPHVEKVMIVPGPEAVTPVQCNDLFRQFGRLAADYFLKTYEDHGYVRPLHVGVTGGARLLAFANALPTRDRENVYIHAAALVGRGRLRDATSHIEPSVAASILWTHCGSFAGHCEYETVEPYRVEAAPGLEARNQITRELKRQEMIPSIEQVIRDMDGLDIVFAGFGFIDAPEASDAMQNRITMGSLLESVVTPKMLAEEGAVGDFCYCPFDADGNGRDDWRFFLTAGHYSDYPGVEFFKHMVAKGKKVVGFGGPYLLPAIKAALKSEMVNVLIIDGPTARQLAEGD